MTTLAVKNFAHLTDVSIEFGDLTVLVGAQGTAKSLALQWLKTALDGRQIVSQLRGAGQDVSEPDKLVDLIFGVGMGSAWSDKTSVTLDRKPITPSSIAKRGNGAERSSSSRRTEPCSSAMDGQRRFRS